MIRPVIGYVLHLHAFGLRLAFFEPILERYSTVVYGVHRFPFLQDRLA